MNKYICIYGSDSALILVGFTSMLCCLYKVTMVYTHIVYKPNPSFEFKVFSLLAI